MYLHSTSAHSVPQWMELIKKMADSSGVEPGNGHTLLSQFLTMETILSGNLAWTTALAVGL